MQLVSLGLQNFRQHAQSLLTFGPGLTGIIGANGSGKSTILEGIAFALYGQPAARGKKETIKFLRAAPRATVRVELVFKHAGHQYKVVRGLSSAECYLDETPTPIANTLTGVSEFLSRTLGMSREEFFCTYFTGQKELAAMAAMQPTERGKFLSRVLGYDRIEAAQESARERKKSLISEIAGLKTGMMDGDVIAQAIREATTRVARAKEEVSTWERESEVRSAARETLVPEWTEAQQRMESRRQIEFTLQRFIHEESSFQRDHERIVRELAAVETANAERLQLVGAVEQLPELRRTLEGLDLLSADYAKRQGLLGVRDTLTATITRCDVALESIGALADESSLEASVATAKADLARVEVEAESARDAWTTELAAANAERNRLLSQHQSQSEQLAQLRAIGEEAPCKTCGQRIGARFGTVVVELEAEIEATMQAGLAAKAKVATWSTTPAFVTIAQQSRANALERSNAAERVLTNARAQRTEHDRLTRERAEANERFVTVTKSLEGLAEGYDATTHATLRSQVASLAATAARVETLNALAAGEAAARAELEKAAEGIRSAEREMLTLRTRLAEEGISDEGFAHVRENFIAAEARHTEGVMALASANAELARASDALAFHEKERDQSAVQRERLAMLEHERFVVEEVDRGYTDLRINLNASLRPELAEIASELLDTLTDGRYRHADIDENYSIVVMEDGIAKPVISGGEEDLCNLILRLAISQMIAQRAGHAFSLLILDEVFGALDDNRRANVIEMLRRLNDRFAQVIVITHIGIGYGLDNVVLVKYEAATGTSEILVGEAEQKEFRASLVRDAEALEMAAA